MIAKGNIAGQLADEDAVSLEALVNRAESLNRARSAQFKAFFDIQADLQDKINTSRIHLQDGNKSAKVVRRIGALFEMVLSSGKFKGGQAKQKEYFDLQNKSTVYNNNNNGFIDFMKALDRSEYA